MPLTIRFAVAFVLVAVLTTALAGYGVRKTTREVLEAEFAGRIEAATQEVHEAVVAESEQIRDLTLPLCTKGTFFDRSLLDLERAKGDVGALDDERRIALHRQVPDEAAARSLDDLWLVTADGTIVAAANPQAVGNRDERLGKLIGKGEKGSPQLRPATEKGGDPSIEVWCSRTQHGYTLGLVGARRIQSILKRVGQAHGVSLAPYDPGGATPASSGDVVVRSMKIDEVTGLAVLATVPRDSLTRTLARLDREIVVNGGIGVLAALFVALVLARNLARPIRELAHETREVITGEPHPVKSRGSREIRDLAESFNRTIDELTRMRKRLAATERIAARREIARQVAHEIKNPLAPIRAAVETLRRLRLRGDDRFDEYFEEATKTVLEEVHRIAHIVSEFTKFSRLPAPNPEPMDLAAVAKRVVALHALDPEQIRTGGGPTEPPKVELSVEPVPEVKADRDQIVQVLTNLIQNGLEAASAVRDDPRVMVTLAPHGPQRVRIVVRDNGPGVTEEMRDKLFEPYATSKASGTGLGLAICHRIVFEHGGEIVYRPATKGGAVFEITLPVAGPSLLDRSIEITSPVGKGPASDR